jgi:hypothetical protein
MAMTFEGKKRSLEARVEFASEPDPKDPDRNLLRAIVRPLPPKGEEYTDEYVPGFVTEPGTLFEVVKGVERTVSDYMEHQRNKKVDKWLADIKTVVQNQPRNTYSQHRRKAKNGTSSRHAGSAPPSTSQATPYVTSAIHHGTRPHLYFQPRSEYVSPRYQGQYYSGSVSTSSDPNTITPPIPRDNITAHVSHRQPIQTRRDLKIGLVRTQGTEEVTLGEGSLGKF